MASQEGVREKVWTCLRGKGPLFRDAQGERIQSAAETSPRDGCELRLSTQTPETGMRR